MTFSKKALIISLILWVVLFVQVPIYMQSPASQKHWPYNRDAKGTMSEGDNTWACYSLKGGYWPCSREEAVNQSLSMIPLRFIFSFYALPALTVQTALESLTDNETITFWPHRWRQLSWAFISFPPISIAILYSMVYYANIALKLVGKHREQLN